MIDLLKKLPRCARLFVKKVIKAQVRMWYVENVFALRASILKRIYWEKMSDILKSSRAARAYFSKNLRINMEDISQNFRAARAFFLQNLCAKLVIHWKFFRAARTCFLRILQENANSVCSGTKINEVRVTVEIWEMYFKNFRAARAYF